MGMSRVVKPERFVDGGLHCGFPETCAEAGATQRPSCGGGEVQAVVSGVGRDVLGEDIDEPRRDGDGASGCAGLGLSEDKPPGDVGEYEGLETGVRYPTREVWPLSFGVFAPHATMAPPRISQTDGSIRPGCVAMR